LHIFWKKRPIAVNFQNTVLKIFIATPIDVLYSNFVKCGRWKIGEIMLCLPDEKFILAIQLLLLRDRAKICQRQPRQCTQSAPDFIQIGSLSAELQPNA